MADIRIADLSDWNEGANFTEYAKERPAVFLKATEGLTFRADTFAPYRAAAHAAGLVLVGAYHFGHQANDPSAEAQHFLSTIGTLGPGEVAILDAENAPSGAAGPDAAWCRRWLGIVMEATDRTPLLYCSWAYWSDRLDSMTDVPLWIAAYHGLGHDDPRDSVPGCRIWQYTDHADVAGVGSADDSVFRGTLDDLAALGGSTPPPHPNPQQEDEMFRYTHAGQDYVFPGPDRGDVYATGTDQQLDALNRAGVPAIGEVDQSAHDMFRALGKGTH